MLRLQWWGTPGGAEESDRRREPNEKYVEPPFRYQPHRFGGPYRLIYSVACVQLDPYMGRHAGIAVNTATRTDCLVATDINGTVFSEIVRKVNIHRSIAFVDDKRHSYIS